MKRLSVLLPLALVVACSATPEAIEGAKSDAVERGFSVLSEGASNADPITGEWVDIEVSFGEGGCTGVIRFEDGKAHLNIELPMPGSPTETTHNRVDDPTVDKLRGNSVFQHCFASRTPQPTA